MYQQRRSGCGFESTHDIRIAQVWTLTSVILMSGGAAASWFVSDIALRVCILIIPVLLLFMIHFSGKITWNYQIKNQYTQALVSAYEGTMIQYTTEMPQPAYQTDPVEPDAENAV